MRHLFKKLSSLIIILTGIGVIIFGISLFSQNPSWILFGGLLFFAGVGYTLTEVGYKVMRGKSVREAITSLIFISQRPPL